MGNMTENSLANLIAELIADADTLAALRAAGRLAHTKTETTGYIVSDREGVIFGCGPLANIAWVDAVNTLYDAGITLVDDSADTDCLLGNWTLSSEMETLPATQALLDQVERKKGAQGWVRTRIGSIYIADVLGGGTRNR